MRREIVFKPSPHYLILLALVPDPLSQGSERSTSSGPWAIQCLKRRHGAQRMLDNGPPWMIVRWERTAWYLHWTSHFWKKHKKNRLDSKLFASQRSQSVWNCGNALILTTGPPSYTCRPRHLGGSSQVCRDPAGTGLKRTWGHEDMEHDKKWWNGGLIADSYALSLPVAAITSAQSAVENGPLLANLTRSCSAE
jgi:hypothetical protein